MTRHIRAIDWTLHITALDSEGKQVIEGSAAGRSDNPYGVAFKAALQTLQSFGLPRARERILVHIGFADAPASDPQKGEPPSASSQQQNATPSRTAPSR